MSVYVESNQGLVRTRNEDDADIFQREGIILMVLADGMGGHPSGHIASKMALKCLRIAFDNFDLKSDKETAKVWLGNVMEQLNTFIFEEAEKVTEYKGMGTTLITALIHDSYILLGNVGDSRGYVITSNEKLLQISEDHTLVAELYRQGGINEEELATHPNKNILLQAIGTEPNITVDIFDLEGGRPEKILLCSDGLTDMVSDTMIEETLVESNDLIVNAKTLISIANKNGGKDNITVALWLNELGAE